MSDGEILPRIERRRTWTTEEKAALLAEVEAEGGKVPVIACRYRISKSVLYGWRADIKAAAVTQARQSTGLSQLRFLARHQRNALGW